MSLHTLIRRAGVAIVTASVLLLSACLLTPGKFDSVLTLQRGGNFSFVYEGEVSMMGLTQMARMAGPGDFKPSCENDAGEDRPCTDAEATGQREAWEKRHARQRQEQERFAKMIGGLDPSDPETADRLAEKLSRQKGWERIDHRGDGLFDVRYAISGNLSHGFLFPVVESVPAVTYFVTVLPRADGSVRVEAAGLGGDGGTDMRQRFGMLAAMSALGGVDKDAPEPVLPDGTFAILTDGEILANNTDEGPQGDAIGMKRLAWKIDRTSRRAPMALIQLD